jgi:pre-mRNA-splicing factor SYF1
VGKLQSLWVAFARFYEEHGDVDNARTVFKQGTEAAFRAPDDLATVWCEWAEMELRHKQYAAALRIMQEATRDRSTRSSGGSGGGGEAGSGGLLQRLRHTQRVWSLYLDLEESLGTLETVRAAYEAAMAIRVVTPANVLNFAAYCEEKGYFEESFRAFERGVALFPWPQVKELWLAYLTKFVERYGGSKLERARDLFEQAVAGAPAAEAAPLYLAYASLEEQFGLARHVMAVYDRAVAAVDEAQRYAMFLAYIRKAEEAYGAPRTREIYARAIEVLPEVQVPDMCLRFADLETKLGELDRARAIFAHAANFCDPRKATAFWDRWQEWETANGNEESFLDMLRTKRSVGMAMATSYSGVQDILEKAASKKARVE